MGSQRAVYLRWSGRRRYSHEDPPAACRGPHCLSGRRRSFTQDPSDIIIIIIHTEEEVEQGVLCWIIIPNQRSHWEKGSGGSQQRVCRPVREQSGRLPGRDIGPEGPDRIISRRVSRGNYPPATACRTECVTTSRNWLISCASSSIIIILIIIIIILIIIIIIIIIISLSSYT